MENQAKTIVTDFLTAIQTGNNERFASLINPDIKWEQPGQNTISGTKHSAAEVFGMVGKMFELSDNTLILKEIKSVTVNGNDVACVLRWQANKANGLKLDVENVDVYSVADGQIISAKIFTADQESEDLFWS
jgi:ketosteroid isomerase-like protein